MKKQACCVTLKKKKGTCRSGDDFSVICTLSYPSDSLQMFGTIHTVHDFNPLQSQSQPSSSKQILRVINIIVGSGAVRCKSNGNVGAMEELASRRVQLNGGNREGVSASDQVERVLWGFVNRSRTCPVIEDDAIFPKFFAGFSTIWNDSSISGAERRSRAKAKKDSPRVTHW